VRSCASSIFRRVGSARARSSNCSIHAARHEPVAGGVRGRGFRQDAARRCSCQSGHARAAASLRLSEAVDHVISIRPPRALPSRKGPGADRKS
jgi:hypothetical protein